MKLSLSQDVDSESSGDCLVEDARLRPQRRPPEADVRGGEALVHGSEPSTDSPFPPRISRYPVAIGHPEAGHRIEDLARESHFDSLADEGSAPHTLAQDALVSEHGVLYQAPPAVS